MNTRTHGELATFIWSICNLLRGPYERNEYRKVILPLTVLRRFDCVLAGTKGAVLAANEGYAGDSACSIPTESRPALLSEAGIALRTRAPDTAWRTHFSHDRSVIPLFFEW